MNRPGYDAELARALPTLERWGGEFPTEVDGIPAWRAALPSGEAGESFAGRNIVVDDLDPGGPDGPPVLLARFRRPDQNGPRPAIFSIHGGGMVAGNRMGMLPDHLDWIEDFGISVFSVEYRLAPEHPYPAQLDDSLAGLEWVLRNADRLEIDPSRVIISGASAGGGIAAALALALRTRGLPPAVGLILASPMLDDRGMTPSSAQYPGPGLWGAAENALGWRALLGEIAGSGEVPELAAPGRAVDLTGLPPLYLDVGSAEVFRDECVAFASRVWAVGGQAELHVWAGGFHGFEWVVPDAEISRAARRARESWLRRTWEDRS